MDRENDRETIIRVEQQLKDSVQNQSQILENQREIFQKLEKESKQLTIVTGDLKGHVESSTIRWDELEKKLSAFDRRITDTEKATKDNAQDLSDEKEERAKFDHGVAASARTAKVIATILGALAAIISTIVGVAVYFKGLG